MKSSANIMLESGSKHKRRSEEGGVFMEERLLNYFLRTCRVGSGREEAREEISGMVAWQVSEMKQKHSRRQNSIFEGYRYLSLCLTVSQKPDCFQDIFHRCFAERVAKRWSFTTDSNYNNNSLYGQCFEPESLHTYFISITLKHCHIFFLLN